MLPAQPHDHRATEKQAGFVLVSVLWVVALLVVITISYHHRARLEVRAARYSLDASQARMAARAAMQRGIVALRNKAVIDSLKHGLDKPQPPPTTHMGQPWARARDLFREEGYLSPGDNFENDVARYTIEDMERFININAASEDLLAELPGMTRPVARRIHYRQAGESDAQGQAQRFQHISELRYIRGVDDDAWYGDDDSPGLRDVLTTYGDGRINLNTAPVEVLQSLPDVDPSVAEDLVTLRSGPDGISGTRDDIGFSDWEQFADATGVDGDSLISLKQFCKFNANYFRIKAVATRRGGMIHSQCSAIVLIPDGSNVASLLSWSEESLGAQ
ncbi:MAG: general secretion pathway protein GspK [Candidatus Hydrogenedentes bacterium]|nr:general secretion pathway protein GspK [Candidatus Hydrogenedentota bacterium]